ncbi:MAG: protein BatD [Sandaracinaceae bacterium]|nr:protein BatD [Sandaracinaceae bacterium]
MTRTLVVLALALVTALASHADAQPAPSATVTMSVDRARVEAGDIVRLTAEARINGEANAGLALPDLSAFDVISRQVSTPFSLRFGFGGAQQVQSTIRHVLTLRARQVGRVTLTPAYVELGGRRFQSEPLTIDVGGAPGDPAPTDPRPTDLPPAQRVDGMQFDADGFLRTWVDEGEPYVGQQVTVTVYLYLARPLRGSPQITQEPTTDGFWVQDLLPPSRSLAPRQQTMGGRSFEVYLLRRFAAFPLSAGELTIGAPAIAVEQSGGIFGIFGGGGGDGTWTRTGQPVTVRVRELPDAGRPRGEPHVGALELAAELDRAQVATGDAVTLTVTASGRGALQQLRVPGPRGDGLEVLAPEVRDALATPDDVVGGTRTFRWLVVPERPGTYPIGPFEVPVFDPRAGTWSVARAPALTLLAAGNAATPEEEPASPRANAIAPGAPIVFGPVHTHSALSRTYVSWTSEPWFLALFALGPLSFLIGLLVLYARKRAARVDPRAAPKRAKRAAQRRLAAAKGHAAASEPRAFYAAIEKALKDVLEAKLARPVGSLTHPELRELCAERGMDEDLAGRLVDELEGCDFARFSAVGVSPAEMESCLGRARALLEGLDRFEPTRKDAP